MVEWKKLGEVCVIKNGYTPSTKENSYWENGTLPWFTLEDIRKNGRILEDAIKHITSLGVKKGGLFPKDSIIVSTTATIGEYALIKSDFLCNQQITCLTIKTDLKEQLLPKYLYYLSDRIGKWCKKNVNGGGSLLIVSTSKLNNFLIPIPSLDEQNRIVGILDTFTASIENLKEQIAQRRKQYEHYRDQLLDLEGKEGVEMKTLGEVCEIKGDYGLSVPSKPFDGVRYLRITDITDMGGLNDDIVSADLKEESNKEPLVDGDILFARTGATVGKTLVYRDELGRCLFAGYLIRYRLIKSIVSPQFMFHFTHSTKYYNWVQSSLAIGAQPNISAQRYNVLNIPVPPLSEQSRIVSILDTFEASIANLEAQLSQREKQYEYYRNKLLTFE